MRFAPVTRRRAILGALLLVGARTSVDAQGPQRRLLSPADLARFRDVAEPELSPDGGWVAYTVSTTDTVEDKTFSDVWMTSWDGARTVRLTWGKENHRAPRWSADGRWLSFLSSRDDAHENDQLWRFDRRGGEAERVTSLPGNINEYAWSPDGKRLALIVRDPDADADSSADSARHRPPKPIVIDRFQFKEDVTGYLTERRGHLYLFDLATRRAVLLTPGAHDEHLPVWSPDGKSIAFVSKRGADPDRSDDWNLYAIDADSGAAVRQLTTYEGDDGDPAWASPPEWSPDGRQIAYIRAGPLKLIYYAVQRLAVIPSAGGEPRLLATSLDRSIWHPHWSADGSAVLFTVEDDRTEWLGSVRLSDGKLERLVAGRQVVGAFTLGGGHLAVLSTTLQQPSEIFAAENGALRALTHQNDALMSELSLGTSEEVRFKSPDGTPIDGIVLYPPGYERGKKYPTILRVHGGPVEQWETAFDAALQLMAANGYVVITPNPRGSSGRGEAFASAIYADWGNKDVRDVLASVDDVVARGIADPARLGVGGWSYGGILTNYIISQDKRFKAAVSGAGMANILAGFGTDQYVREYVNELGSPWTATATWLKLSSPFLHADRIVTPTLFLCGDKDFNVPLQNSEQMYQALKTLGRDTQLVIYPGEYHDIARPSFLRDRLERYLAWYGSHLGSADGQPRSVR